MTKRAKKSASMPRAQRAPKAPRVAKPKGPKKVSYEFIEDSLQEPGRSMYGLLRTLVREHHPELRDARIALAWCSSWQPDADGRQVLGKCKKASDLDRELAAFDLVILLHRGFWIDVDVEDRHRAALLDHELCHATLQIDARGEPVEDERGRKVYRLRKHDIEEFNDVIRRHGVWRKDVEDAYHALREAAAAGWQPCDACKDNSQVGFVDVEDADGTIRADRCPCWKAHMQRLDGMPPARPGQPRLMPTSATTTTVN